MIQPYPYWVFKSPLAYFVCLYANDVNGGQLDDPESDATPQFNWLVDTLKAIRKDDDGRAVLLTIHYPPFSGASNFPERGNPNLVPEVADTWTGNESAVRASSSTSYSTIIRLSVPPNSFKNSCDVLTCVLSTALVTKVLPSKSMSRTLTFGPSVMSKTTRVSLAPW